MAMQAKPTLPDKLTFTSVEGEAFVRIREAARLAKIHPVIIEMGQHLLKQINLSSGAVFKLETPDMLRRADDIQKVFAGGLRRVAKAFKPGSKYKVKSHRDGGRLVFWYSA